MEVLEMRKAIRLVAAMVFFSELDVGWLCRGSQ
jgi:hypothetical protein